MFHNRSIGKEQQLIELRFVVKLENEFCKCVLFFVSKIITSVYQNSRAMKNIN